MTRSDPRAIARTGLFQHYRTNRVRSWIEVTGSSMEPLIQPGNRLLVAFGERPERTGQVILCAIDGAFVAHRLVSHRLIPGGSGVPSIRLIAKGDAEAYPDRSISPEDVYGVVRAVRRADGRIVTVGLDDTPGAIVALASWWGGSAAWLGRRVIRHAPARTASPLLTTLLILSRLPTRVITALMPWLVQERRAEGR
jgi:hypothetical protein